VHIVGDEVLQVLTTTTERNNRTEQLQQLQQKNYDIELLQGHQSSFKVNRPNLRPNIEPTETGRNFEQLMNNLGFQGQEVIGSFIGGRN